jgi:double-strand break repair protein MRE11
MTVISGSSVATSLCEGEAVKKHVAILHLYKREFQVYPIALKTVRPFVFDSLVLADCTIDFTTEKPSEEVRLYSFSVMVRTTYMVEVSGSLKCARLCFG